jgi:integrase/recombinase XerD
MQSKPVVSLYLDTRHKLKNGRYSLKVRVDFSIGGRQRQKYYSTGHDLSTAQWDKIRTGSVPFSLRKAREEAFGQEARANEIVSSNPNISPDLFDALFVGRYAQSAGAALLFDEAIAKLEEEGRIGTAESYRCAKVSLNEYSSDFPLSAVDGDFLKGYERWMTGKGKSLTTVGIYLRALRAIYNTATERRMISRDLYPFGTKRYIIPKGSNVKKALDRAQKVKLEEGPQTEAERRAVAMWMFSYYCNGMNFTDMAHLTADNDQGEVIVFTRRKTMRTARVAKKIVVPVRPEARQILQEYGGNKPFLFGIITDAMPARDQYLKIKDWIKKTNAQVNQVAGRLGMGKVNTYSARHTFATALLRGNANPKEISESLGHSSMAVTEAYLKGLDLEGAKKLSKLL